MSTELRLDDGAGVGPLGEEHPRTPGRRRARTASTRSVDGELLLQERSDLDARRDGIGDDADRQIDPPAGEVDEQAPRRPDLQSDLESGVIDAEGLENPWVVVHGSGIDHADTQLAQIGAPAP